MTRLTTGASLFIGTIVIGAGMLAVTIAVFTLGADVAHLKRDVCSDVFSQVKDHALIVCQEPYSQRSCEKAVREAFKAIEPCLERGH